MKTIKFKKKYLFLKGKTGCGKSYKIVQYALNPFKNQNSQEVVVIALPSLLLLAEIKKNFYIALETIAETQARKGKKFNIEISEEQIKIKKEKILKDWQKFVFEYTAENVKTGTLYEMINENDQQIPCVIFTTHSYLHKRGHSQLVYSFFFDLLWLKREKNKNLTLFVDESHNYFDSLIWTFRTRSLFSVLQDIGGKTRQIPVKYFEKLKSEEYIEEDVIHHYTIDLVSKNPTIMPAILQDDACFNLKKEMDDCLLKNFLKVGEELNVTCNSSFDRTYEYFSNNSFSFEKLSKNPFFISERKLSPTLKAGYTSVCKKLNVVPLQISALQFKKDIEHLISNTPYLVKCKNNSQEFGSNFPGSLFYSGLDYFSLSLLDTLFDKIA